MGNENNQDVETESLKLAIEQIADDETAALPHLEQLSTAVSENTGNVSAQGASMPIDSALTMTQTGSPSADLAPADHKISSDTPHGTGAVPSGSAPHKPPHKPRHKSVAAGQDRISTWFLTFMCMNIPVIGWIYLFYLAFSKKKRDRRNFARAYLFYKLVFLVAGLIILAAVAVTAMNLLEELLDYMQML